MTVASQHIGYAPAHQLTLAFLRWVADQPRSYDDAMEAWRTSCPRLSIWEDALADGLVIVQRIRADADDGDIVVLTATGRSVLAEQSPGSTDHG